MEANYSNQNKSLTLNFSLLFLIFFVFISATNLLTAQTITKERSSDATFFEIVATNTTAENFVDLDFSNPSAPTVPIKISSITITGANASEFSHNFTPKTTGYLDGEKASFIISFTPTSEGEKTATLTINYNDGNSNLEIPISATAKNAGVYAKASQIDFGSVEVGQEKRMPMNLEFVTTDPNDPSKNIKIDHIDFVGANAADFIQRNNFDPSGYSGEGGLDVTFQPKTGGNKIATVQVYHDGPGTNPVEITLTGSSNVPLIPVLEVPSGDFGTHDIFTTTTKDFVLKNTGNTPLIISDIHLRQSKDYNQFSIPNFTFPIEIAPQSNYTFTSTFSPTDNFYSTGNGNRSATLIITSNDNNETDKEDVIFFSSAIYLPDFKINNTSYYFGSVLKPNSKTQKVTLTNDGDGTLVVEKFFSNSSDFTSTDTFPITIPPHSNKDVSIQYKPTALGSQVKIGYFTAKNDGSVQVSTFKKKTLTINLYGYGIEKRLEQPTDITFNDTRVDGNSTKSFVLKPTGGEAVTISNIELSGPDTEGFAITSATSKTIEKDQTYTVNVAFNPYKTGLSNATITVTSDALNNPITFNISGNGITSKLETSLASLTFDDTNILEKSANKKITLSNTDGTDAVTISAINFTGDNAAEFKVNETTTFPIVINAGDTKDVELFFVPRSGGAKTATAEIVSNDSNSLQKITLQANALSPNIVFNKSIINFPKTDVGNKRTEFYTVQNTGSIDLIITSIDILGTNASSFSQDNAVTFPITIPAGTNRYFKVFYTPTTAGIKTASLKINTQKIGFKELAFMATATSPILSVSNAIDFGTFNKTTESNVHPITIKNTGTSNLKIYKATISGADASSFSVTNSFPVTIKPNNSLVLQTQFNFASTGTKNATINLTTNTTTTNNIAVTANLTNLPTFKAQAYFALKSGEVGDKTYTPYVIENTGSAPLVIDGTLALNANSCCTSLERYNWLPTEYQNYNKFPITIPAGQKDSILITFSTGITDADKPIKVKGYLAINKATNSYDNDYLNLGDYIPVTFSGGVLRPKFEITSTTPVTAAQTSIGRSSEVKITVKNTGNSPLQFYEKTDDTANGFYFKDYPIYVTSLEPEESKEFTVIFKPNGTLGTKNGLLKIKTRGDGTYNNPFVIHEIPISGIAVEAKEVTTNGMTFTGDKITVNGDETTISGNVHAGDLEFSADVIVNTATNVVKTNGKVFVLNVKKVGDLGGDKVLLQEGDLDFKIDKDVKNVANLALLGTSKITNKAFSLVGIPVQITKFKLIDDGIQMGGKLALPPEIFGENANITIETIEISKSNGINIKGSAEISPALKILKTLSLNNAKVTFDTFTNSFSGEAELEINLIDKKITIAGKIAIVNGGLDEVSLEIETDPGIPLANTGFALAGGNGFIKGIQNPPLSLGLGVDIVPILPIETIRFDNMELTYTFGTSFGADGTVELFGEKLAHGSLKVITNTTTNTYGIKTGISVNLYDIFKGDVDLSILSKDSKLYLEGNALLSVTIPKIKAPCFVCGPINALLPYKIAELNTHFDNTSVSARLTIAKVLDVQAKIARTSSGYKTTFGGNFKPLDLKFKPGFAAKGLPTNSLKFEHNTAQMDIDPLEGQSLLVNASKNSIFKGKTNTTQVPFAFSKTHKTIILRVEGTNSTPKYTVTLPDNSVVNPTNAASLGYFQSDYDEAKQSYYIINNAPAGNYTFNIEGTDPYQVDIAGDEFAPSLAINSLNYNAANNETIINWTDGDIDSDAKISLFYATDKKGNGVQMVSDISEDSTTDSYTFDTSNLKNGTYYVYGVIQDDTNTPVIAYSNNTFTVNKTSSVKAPELTSSISYNTVQLSWSAIANADHYLVYVDDKQVSNLSNNENVGNTTSFDLTKLSPGKTYTIAVSAVMADNSESNLSNIETVNFVSTTINNVPVITTTSLPDKNDDCAQYTTTITATDADTSDTLTYELANAPTGMAIVGNEIQWTPKSSQFGLNAVTVKVSDGNGGTDTKNYQIVVNKVDDVAPTFTTATLPDIVRQCSYTVNTTPTATDNCKGVINGVPNQSSFTGIGEHTLVWSYDDGNGNISTQNQKVIIEDTQIPVVVTKNITIDLGKTGTKTITAADVDNGSSDNCTVATKTLSKSTFTNADIGTVTIQLTITDAAGNQASKDAIITVTNTTLAVEDFSVDLEKAITIYPNPVTTSVYIKYNQSKFTIQQIDIFDISGKKVSNISLSKKNNTINVQHLASGIYILKIVSDKGSITKRFIKK